MHVLRIGHLTSMSPSAGLLASLSFDSMPADTCRTLATEAGKSGDDLRARIWLSLAHVLVPSPSRPVQGLLAQGFVLDMCVGETLSTHAHSIRVLQQRYDLEALGLLACLLEQHRRSAAVETSQPVPPAVSTPQRVMTPRIPTPGTHSPYLIRPIVQTPPTPGGKTPGSWGSLGSYFNQSAFAMSTPNTPSMRAPGSDGSPNVQSSPARSRRQSVAGTENSPTDATTALKGFVPKIRATAPPLLSRRSSRNMISRVTFGGTSVIAPDPAAQTVSPAKTTRKVVFKRMDEPAVSMLRLPQEVEDELECHRFALAELLYRYGLLDQRLHVLRLTRAAQLDSPLIAIQTGVDDHLSEFGDDARLTHAGIQNVGASPSKRGHTKLGCSICHLPVHNIARACTTCLHGVHIECGDAWFAEEPSCPAGCGCECKQRPLQPLLYV